MDKLDVGDVLDEQLEVVADARQEESRGCTALLEACMWGWGARLWGYMQRYAVAPSDTKGIPFSRDPVGSSPLSINIDVAKYNVDPSTINKRLNGSYYLYLNMFGEQKWKTFLLK